MDNEACLMRTLKAPVAPKRDVGFTLAVMRAAEQRRFRRASTLMVLRTTGAAAAAAALVIPALSWAGGNPEGLQTGVLMTGAILALLSLARIMSQRIAVAAR